MAFSVQPAVPMMEVSLVPVAIVSVLGMALTYYLLPRFKDMFIKAGLFGIDLSKRKPADGSPPPKVPESAGVISGTVFLIVTFVLIPLVFSDFLGAKKDSFPHAEFVQLLSALLSISCMLLLGFADDVLDLRWRDKLMLPSLASLPILVVYYVTENRTDVVLPVVLRSALGTNVDLGFLYYVFIGMLAVFCTNAINIFAGINGLEAGQSLVIAASVALFNLNEINGALGHYHRFSLYFLLPYLATTLPLLYYNWYPSRVFCGDTFCYFSGMTLAVVAILGHFSKTLLLFFIPQVGNFLYSLPQLFRFVPCPRHRVPKYNPDTDLMEMSQVEFKDKDMKILGRLALAVFRLFQVVKMDSYEKDGEKYHRINNLTLINFALKIVGPVTEARLTTILLIFQVLCSVVAFVIRYPLARMCYGEIIA